MKKSFEDYFPGLCVSITIGVAALFLSDHYGAPAMLMALLLGLAFHFLDDNEKCQKGLNLSAKTLLRLAVALLGLRITLDQVHSFGLSGLLIVMTSVFLTLLFGFFVAKAMEFKGAFGILTGGSVAICGASAAMAISSVLPEDKQSKNDLIFTIIGVTTLSTVAMVLYPILTSILGLNEQQSGLLLGATIHDVAQVTGAGYSISPQVGDISTFFKLLRVAMLVPIVLMISFFAPRHTSSQEGRRKSIQIPAFLIGFIILFLINSFMTIPSVIIDSAKSISSMLLLTAVAALGIKTSLTEINKLGFKPIILIVSETLFILLFVMLMIKIV